MITNYANKILHNGRSKYFTIVLLSDWMGYPKGCELTINETVAKTLVDRGCADFVIENEEEKIMRKESRRLTRRK